MKIKCNVCGKRFMPAKEDIYAVTEPLSLADCLINLKTVETYDAVDCPICGCQVLLKKRMPRMIEEEGSENEN